ncbi:MULTISPECIES: proton-conducting transporter membrane subunit [unclassified Leeuwenhoekiella]|uniref:proton-conducting transporter transmembrane domain-containing protein n=1 Tax=unclassified Leeuwenhoekiella TaxID=2615029 RepID=UPI000C41F99F|nr:MULTISPECIES: proton-conducting transporter membrane subunit [unclassified Leeuwenhoekiella]MAW96906.1 pesticidal protein Cry28Aa [Leeuwenhoekiella sp.]MBA80610.1 pesticidal protein Cry28Aa [Leeuwenhoekiella sp.]|tara:strand:+ start:27460 stop:28932 length:1473 start_codon:yes stop_codon:yes gene_type:complete
MSTQNTTYSLKLNSGSATGKTNASARVVSLLLWLLFAANLTGLIVMANSSLYIQAGDWITFNHFSLLIWTTVTFFGAVVSTYAANYLKGFRYHSRFMGLTLTFTATVMLLVVANHLTLLVISWLLMGVLMSRLIGIDKDWAEARAASRFTLSYFLTGSLFLGVAVIGLALYTGQQTLSGLSIAVASAPKYVTLPAALLIILAALVQSAIYPFHRWLMSAMTAPTPASALMHAGFVNGSGILLTLFATVLFASNTLTLLFIIGGLTAIIAQFAKLLQVHVKQKLACSTIAQMGFMIMQCGLGFFNAAIAHLILHGFYKAYLFLSSGEEIAQSKPEKAPHLHIKPLQAVVVLIYGILGAMLFAILTGKGLNLNSSVFLTLIVAITVGQATYNIVKEQSLSTLQKTVLPPVLFFLGIGAYALIYNGITFLMRDLPKPEQALPLSWPQIIFGIIFLIGFFAMKLGLYHRLPWLYVKLLNLTQPHKKTVLLSKSK